LKNVLRRNETGGDEAEAIKENTTERYIDL